MDKIVRIIHISKLSKDEIFQTFSNLDKCKFVNWENYNYQFSDSWKRLKNYINNEESIDCLKGIPENYVNLVVVDMSTKKNDSVEGDEFSFVDIPYLLAFLFQLDEEYRVVFYESATSDRNANYFRLSIFLNTWLTQNGLINNFFYLDIESEITSKQFNPKKFAFSFSRSSRPSLTVLPIISLNEKVYFSLEEPYNSLKDNKDLNNLMDQMKGKQKDSCYAYYKEYIYQSINQMLNSFVAKIEWEDNHNSFLSTEPPLIVLYIYGIIASHMSLNDLKKIGFEALIEKSYDYSNGLMQLIENSIKHVVNKDKEHSFAFFTIRMHHNKGAMDTILKSEEFKEMRYFLEISVIDGSKELDEPGIVNNYNKILDKNGISHISSLSDVFNGSEAIEQYYNNVDNVANHYGLQIFDTILTSNYGLFTVKSGKRNACDTYNNALKSKFGKEQIYNSINEEHNNHFSGTDYNIVLPVERIRERAEVGNVFIGNTPLLVEDIIDPIETISIKRISLSKSSKDEFVKKYYKELVDGLNTGKEIVAIDTSDICKDRIHRELLCKAVITYIANIQDTSVICLLGIMDKYQLLDMVRIIALFYDKTGECRFMKGKGIYLCTDDCDYEVLFSGDNIKSVIENIDRQRLLNSLPLSFYDHIYYAISDRTNAEEQS